MKPHRSLSANHRCDRLPNRQPARTSHFTLRASAHSAFTLIEIALSLAVIGFALVAVIGILPTGMQVQKDNRQETIINQDATYLIEAIRNGARGLDDLTNYVYAITNYVTTYDANTGLVSLDIWGHTYTDTSRNGASAGTPFPITNGYRIVGLLSAPKYVPSFSSAGGFTSNHVTAYVHAISGAATEKFPQKNPAVRELAFSYRLISDVVPFASYDPSWTNYTDPAITGNTNEITARFNYFLVATNLQNNLHDLRLTFRWPLLSGNDVATKLQRVGNGRQVYRTMASGYLLPTNDFGYPLHFFQSQTYAKGPF